MASKKLSLILVKNFVDISICYPKGYYLLYVINLPYFNGEYSVRSQWFLKLLSTKLRLPHNLSSPKCYYPWHSGLYILTVKWSLLSFKILKIISCLQISHPLLMPSNLPLKEVLHPNCLLPFLAKVILLLKVICHPRYLLVVTKLQQLGVQKTTKVQ